MTALRAMFSAMIMMNTAKIALEPAGIGRMGTPHAPWRP